MKQRRLGTQGLQVSEISLGCMGMSEFYGPADEAEALAAIDRALELGVTMLDTADIYGYGDNERLVGRAVRARRDQVVVATKFGIRRRKHDPAYRGISGRPEYVREACEASLARLGLGGLAAGIGVHSGPVVEGLLGSPGVMGYDVIGDTVNTAKRIEGAALGGEVLVSEPVRAALDPGTRCGERREVLAKGKEAPIEVHLLA